MGKAVGTSRKWPASIAHAPAVCFRHRALARTIELHLFFHPDILDQRRVGGRFWP